MKKFQFSKAQFESTTFRGQEFYNVYKDAEFLRNDENITSLLSKGYELRKMLKVSKPGESLAVGEMYITKNIPLMLKNTGPNIAVEDFEFTNNRLTGLVAAYAYENRQRFPILIASEPLTLGLQWDCNDALKCRLFLSAVTGAEHFTEQFGFWPLVCALRKLQIKKITENPVVKIAKKKNHEGVKLSVELKNNLDVATVLWSKFPGTTTIEMKTFLRQMPDSVRRALEED